MRTSLLLFFALAANAIAGVQSSANYTVMSDVVDAGGARVTSASYVNDGSVGGFGGVVTANAPQETARTGYAGQLYEVTAFTLTAASTNLNEATATPLSAMQYLDDGTVSPANDFAQWSVSGPIAGIDDNGIATAASVSQNTPATIQARLEGWTAVLNLLVLNVEVLPGYNQIAGQLVVGGQMRLTFVGSNGVSYALDRSFNLSPANWVPQLTNSASAGGVLVFTNTPVSSTNNFWRIRSVP
jgi:hypothetical protein